MDFLRSHLIMNAPLSVDYFQSVITVGWLLQQTHPKVMTENGQLTKVHSQFIDFLRNP
jgi:hypothetical protein